MGEANPGIRLEPELSIAAPGTRLRGPVSLRARIPRTGWTVRHGVDRTLRWAEAGLKRPEPR